MNSGTNTTPQIFVLALFLTVTWGIYMLYTIVEYRRIVRAGTTRGRIIRDFRRMVVAVCLWLLVSSLVFRTTMVLIGLDDVVVGRVLFYALVGSNVIGSLFVVASLFFDDD